MARAASMGWQVIVSMPTTLGFEEGVVVVGWSVGRLVLRIFKNAKICAAPKVILVDV